MKILELTAANDAKWNTEIKDRKLSSEVERIKTKHDNEYNALVMKMNLEINEFNKSRSEELEK